MSKYQYNPDNEGSITVLVVLLLALITIIGISATTNSTIEKQISTNELRSQRSFYTAEAGMEHAMESLRSEFEQTNSVVVASGGTASWTFALDGNSGYPEATGLDMDGAVPWFNNESLGGNTYSVFIWNNNDNSGSPSATADEDGLIFVRAVSTDPWGTETSIEVLLSGTGSGSQAIGGYDSQEAGNSGKNNNSTDANAITDFSEQL